MTGKSNQFAKFVSTSPLSTISHDPFVTLASNCIRECFGPTVQLVADGLITRGESTLPHLVAYIEEKCPTRSKRHSKGRKEILKASKMRVLSLRSDECPSRALIRASLLVLLQHSIVTVQRTEVAAPSSSASSSSNKKRKPKVLHMYQIDIHRARLLSRYPRFIQYIHKAYGDAASVIVEEILSEGRLHMVQVIVRAIQQQQQQGNDKTTNASNQSAKSTSDSNNTMSNVQSHRKLIIEAFVRLVRAGYIQEVSNLTDVNSDDAERDDDEGEFEFGEDNNKTKQNGTRPAKKKIKRTNITDTQNPPASNNDDDEAAVTAILQDASYHGIDRMALWRVNTALLHEMLRAFRLGWLVYERYGSKIDKSGSVVTAGLKVVATRRHAPVQYTGVRANDFDSVYKVSVQELMKYLPRTTQQDFEKKEGGAAKNLYHTLMALSRESNPKVIVEDEGGTGQIERAKFQINTHALVSYLQERTVHQTILDRHGEVAARICSILGNSGYMESDAIAEAAMVPAKDTRENLHLLYRDTYIDLFNVNIGKQHNPASMVYLWTFSKPCAYRVIVENICTALCNMRRRRQHEVEVGKAFIERAKDDGAVDENEHEADKKEYHDFCIGLERLDNAIVQLDEALMTMKDY